MKHLKKGRKFSREKKQRKALVKIMLGDFLLKGRMKTTEAKAKEIKTIAEKTISRLKKALAGEKDAKLALMRNLKADLPRNVTPRRLEEVAKNFENRKSGYARVIKTGQRKSDGAKLAVIELIKE